MFWAECVITVWKVDLFFFYFFYWSSVVVLTFDMAIQVLGKRQDLRGNSEGCVYISCLVFFCPFPAYQVEDNFVLENEKEKFVEELRAIVSQAQDILRSLPLEDRVSGMESAPDPANTQVSSASLSNASFLEWCLLVLGNSLFIFIYSFLIQTGSSEQVQINPASTQTGSK